MNKKFLFDREGVGAIFLIFLVLFLVWTFVIILVNMDADPDCIKIRTILSLGINNLNIVFSMIVWYIGIRLLWKALLKSVCHYLLSINDNDKDLRRLLISDNKEGSITWYEQFDGPGW